LTVFNYIYQKLQKFTRKPEQNTEKFDIAFDNRKVDFLICGTQKGGTTALNAYLKKHPEICLAKRKEVHFFDNEQFFRKKTPEYALYHSFFTPQATHKVIGEATPIYMYWHNAPRRIWEYNPHMKLIVILRNPIKRAYSHWNMERSRNADNLSFWDAIQNEQERCRESLPYQHRIYSYIDRGFYLEQIRRLWLYFPKNRVLILKNEDLRNHPFETLQTIYNYLEIEPFKNIEGKDVYSTPYESEMGEREKNYLRSIFEYEIQGIERSFGWDCNNWLLE
jgi:hypothetical protein